VVPGLCETSSEDGGSSPRAASVDSSCSGNFVDDMADPWFWLEEPDADEKGFGPDVSEAPPASRPLHVQDSSDKGVQFDGERGGRKAEEFDSGPRFGSTVTPVSGGSALPSQTFPEDRWRSLCRDLCSGGG
jgi:hypothetical protein